MGPRLWIPKCASVLWIILNIVLTDSSFSYHLEDTAKYDATIFNEDGGRLKRQAQEERCAIPAPLENGHFSPSPNRCPPEDTTPLCQLIPGTLAPSHWVIHYYCNPGYHMNTTKFLTVCFNGQWRPALPTCHDLSALTPAKLLVGKKNGVSVFDTGLSEQTVFLNHTQDTTEDFSPSVDYHFSKNYIFFASVDRIYRDEMVNLGDDMFRKGVPKLVVTAGMVGPVRLAVDWVHDKVYWLSDVHRTVESSNLDGSGRTLLLKVVPNLNYPHNIGVDPYTGNLFVASNSSLWRANLDGTDLTRLRLEDEQGKMVRCFSVDVRRRRIFYSYRVLNIGITYIGSCDYDGKNGRDHPLMNRDSYVNIISLDVYRDTLYFGHYTEDTDGYSLWSVNLTNPLPLMPVLVQNVAREVTKTFQRPHLMGYSWLWVLESEGIPPIDPTELSPYKTWQNEA